MTARSPVLDRAAVAVILAATLAILVVTLVWHRTPLYGVETDLLGDSVPAARALSRGDITPDTFLFRGPGYPVLLAAASRLAGGDEYLAARLLNVAAFAAAAVFASLLVRALLGSAAALAVTAALVANPVAVRGAIEAGSDMPALALALAATWLVTSGGGARRLAAAGLLAAIAFATRYNTVFLLPAGVACLLGRKAPGRHLLVYLAAFALPVAAWFAAQMALTGAPPRNQNFVNVAFEVYGAGLTWERFWVESGSAFGSFLDVVRYDPGRFVLHVARNFATRWLTDAQQLMPPAIGALALPGLLFAWRGRPGAPALGLHLVLAYLVLTLVFYAPRFFLYLLPFYLSGTFGLLLWPHVTSREGQGPRASGLLSGWRRLGPLAAAALVLVSGVAAAREARRMLADPPDETRLGGERLRELGRPGERVLARKPHVAYFAGMVYVPIPYAEAFTDFLAQVRRSEADYLFISPVETWLHPQLSVLADSGVSLPGLEPIAHGVPRGSRFFSIYRLVESEASIPQIQDSLLVAVRRFAERRPGQAWPQTYLGGHLVTMGRYREAIAPLAAAERLDPADPLVARFQALAHAELGELEPAAEACLRALRRAPDGTWERGFLGQIRLAQGRYGEAREELHRAMRGEPANPRYPLLYLRASALGGSWADAAGTAEQILRVSPRDGSARLLGARAWLLMGRADRARALLELPGEPAGPDSAAAAALADSLRAPPRPGESARLRPPP